MAADFNMSAAEASKLFKEVDTDGSGRIEFGGTFIRWFEDVNCFIKSLWPRCLTGTKWRRDNKSKMPSESSIL